MFVESVAECSWKTHAAHAVEAFEQFAHAETLSKKHS
jgi:hypothetical protein